MSLYKCDLLQENCENAKSRNFTKTRSTPRGGRASDVNLPETSAVCTLLQLKTKMLDFKNKK